jgi:hypothetical protein
VHPRWCWYVAVEQNAARMTVVREDYHVPAFCQIKIRAEPLLDITCLAEYKSMILFPAVFRILAADTKSRILKIPSIKRG